VLKAFPVQGETVQQFLLTCFKKKPDRINLRSNQVLLKILQSGAALIQMSTVLREDNATFLPGGAAPLAISYCSLQAPP
jgi:hypothetical protein